MSAQTVLVLCVLITGACTVFGQGCDKILITGTKFSSATTGIYQVSSGVGGLPDCDGKSVYEQLNGGYYLHYFMDFGYEHWMISPHSNCSGTHTSSVNDTADVPEEIEAIWNEVSNGEYVPSPGMKATCFDTFQGCAKLSVSGIAWTSPHYELRGGYNVMTNEELCYGKYIYKHSYKNYYLFSHSGIWYISDTACEHRGRAATANNAIYPELITTTWEETEVYSNGSFKWVQNQLFVQCEYPTTTTLPSRPGRNGAGINQAVVMMLVLCDLMALLFSRGLF